MKKLNNGVYDTIDPYLDDLNCIERLIKTYEEFGSLIIAFDFDNTVYDYYKKGYRYDRVISLLKEAKKIGFTLILFTCCDESKYEEMRNHCKEVGIEPDYINETPKNIPFGTPNKVYYNILLDDRAGLSSAYNQLKTVIKLIKDSSEK